MSCITLYYLHSKTYIKGLWTHYEDDDSHVGPVIPGFDHFGDGVGAVGARTHDPADEPSVDGPARRSGSLAGEFADVPVDFEELAEGVDWKKGAF